MSDATPADCNIIIILWFFIHTHTRFRACGKFLPTSEQILKFCSGVEKMFWVWGFYGQNGQFHDQNVITWSTFWKYSQIVRIWCSGSRIFVLGLKFSQSHPQNSPGVESPTQECSGVLVFTACPDPMFILLDYQLPLSIIILQRNYLQLLEFTELTLHSTPEIFLIIYLRNTTQCYRVVVGVCISRGGVRHIAAAREVLWLAGPGVGGAGVVAKVTTIWLVVSLVPDNHTTLTWVSRTGLVPL